MASTYEFWKDAALRSWQAESLCFLPSRIFQALPAQHPTPSSRISPTHLLYDSHETLHQVHGICFISEILWRTGVSWPTNIGGTGSVLVDSTWKSDERHLAILPLSPSRKEFHIQLWTSRFSPAQGFLKLRITCPYLKLRRHTRKHLDFWIPLEN